MLTLVTVTTAPWAHIVFDLFAWTSGGLLGFVLYRWRLRGQTATIAGQINGFYFLALAVGTGCGAWAAGSINTLQDQAAPALSHSIVGALVGAIVAVELYKRVRGIAGSTGTVFVGSFALGVVIGRLGCLFTGLSDRTFGTPTSLAWAVDLGDHIGRHPVQIYEAISMAVFLVAYLVGLAQRRDWALRRGFYALAVVYGAQRFVWEFLKPYPTLVGPLNLFHLMCAGLVVYGIVYWRADLVRARCGNHDSAA